MMAAAWGLRQQTDAEAGGFASRQTMSRSDKLGPGCRPEENKELC